MKKFTLYIGLNDRVTKRQEIPLSKARDIIYDTLFDYGVKGFTVYHARGVWQYEDESVSEENTFIVEILGTVLPDGIIPSLKDLLNQESIGLSEEWIEVKFL